MDAEEPPRTLSGDQETTQLEVRFKDLVVTVRAPVAEPTGGSQHAKTYSTIGSVLMGVVRPPKTQYREILKGVSGVLRPGTMTLVLGQPGSGKSTFLKALSGRLRDDDDRIRISGQVTYNGKSQRSLSDKLPQIASYVPQEDQHFSMLTVQETLAYAQAFNTRRDDMATSGDQVMATLQAQLGLQHCWDTIVGDEMVRGVSGGEKKRVTTGEMQFGGHQAAFMDEISTGLDSVTTFDIVNTQRTLVKTLGKTVVISLLQPTPEVFALFDDVILFHDGEVMYYGPTASAAGFFSGVGLECPPGGSVADFLLDVGTPQQRKYERGLAVPRTAAALADHFRKSESQRVIERRFNEPPGSETYSQLARSDQLFGKPRFQRSVWHNMLRVTRRQLDLLLRDKETLGSRAILVVILATFNGTTFLDGDPTNAPAVLAGVFVAAMSIAFEQTSQLAALQSMRDIFYKQRAANFFQTSAYVVGTALSQILIVLAEILLFGTMVYWISGYEADATRFFIFLGILFLSTVSANLTFFFISAASPSAYFTVPAGFAVLEVILSFSGFMIPRTEIPDYLIWVFWLNPMSWAYRALAINYYRSPKYDVCVYDGVEYCRQYGSLMSEYNLKLVGLPTERKWIAFGAIYEVGASLVLMMLTYVMLEFKRYDSRSTRAAFVPSTETNHEAGNYELATTPVIRDTEIPVRSRRSVCTPVTVAFQNLWYSVPSPQKPTASIDLLKGVTGFAHPGTMTALMGSSGAGKTTLLDVIAGRKNMGTIKGEILLNGHPASKLAIRRATGYCEQTGIHSATATVREALTFSAFLRQESDVPDGTKYDSVDECLELLGLDSIADRLAGSLSLEQSKRLTIGVELAAQPSVLFLDEPTSGLDARSAKMIMDSIRSVADSGRTIICTIHQPSQEVFSVFDRLLLLQRGGETVFFGDLGDNYRTLIDYFEAHPSVQALPEEYNPATWMLECIAENSTVNFPETFLHSKQRQLLDAVMQEEGVGRPSSSSERLVFESTHAATASTQLKLLTQRFIRMYWRSPSHYVTILGTTVAAVVVLGIAAIGLDTTSYQGLMAALGIMFVMYQFQSNVSYNSAIPFGLADRSAFYREQATHTYHAVWYWVGMTIAEVPYIFVKALIVSVGIFLFLGLTGVDKFVLFWLASTLGMLVDLYLGQLLAFLLPTMIVATLTGSVIGAATFMYVGFMPPGGAIPSWYQWFYTINPLRYAFPTLVAIVYADCSTEPVFDAASRRFVDVGPERGCQPLKNSPAAMGNATAKELIEKVYNMKHDDIGRNFGVLILCAVVLRVLTLVAMRYLNHQKR